jgi:sporulation protein YqfC
LKKIRPKSRKKINKHKHHLTKVFELPAEAVSGDFRLIAISNTDIFLENHHGVLQYTQKRLMVDTKEKKVLFMGKDILLKKMGKKNMIIQGNIDLIEFIEK